MSDNTDFEMFLQLEDVQGTGLSKATQASIESDLNAIKAERVEAENYESQFNDDIDISDNIEQEDAVDWSFLEDGVKFEDEINEPDETPEVEEQDDEDSEEVDSGDYDDSEENVGDVEVDEETTLDLPDGRVMTVGTLQKLALQGEALEQREQAINQRIEQFNAEYEAAKDTLEVSQLEVDNILQSYTEEYLEDLYNNDPVAYAEQVRYIDKMKARKQSILNSQARIKAQQEAAQDAKFKQEADACVATLKQVIPTWNDTLYEKLMNFAVNEYHENPDDVLKWNKPSDFIRLYELYNFKQGKAKAATTLKGVKKGGKFLSSGGARVQASKEAERDKAARMLNQGKMSPQEAFAFLED